MTSMTRRGGGASVLIENARGDARRAQQDDLVAGGFDVTTCAGPGRLAGDPGCDLVTTGGCALVEAADVLLYDLDLDEPTDREVLRAVRRMRPELPVVVEVPGDTARRHRDVLEGCTVVMPYSPARVRQAVCSAVG